MHFVDEENIVTFVDFDCGITFYTERPTKNRLITRERNHICRSFEKSSFTPGNRQHNCFFDKQHSCNIFLDPYNLWDMFPAAIVSRNQTNDRYSMSNQYPQPTTRRPIADSYPVSSSPRTMDSERKGLSDSFAFFQSN